MKETIFYPGMMARGKLPSLWRPDALDLDSLGYSDILVLILALAYYPQIQKRTVLALCLGISPPRVVEINLHFLETLE